MVQTAVDRDQLFAQYLNFPDLVKGGSVEPHWLKDHNSFWYVDGPPNDLTAYLVDPDAGTRQPLFDIPRLRDALSRRLGHDLSGAGLPFTSFTLSDDLHSASFELEGKDFTLDLETYEVSSPLYPATEAQKEARKIKVVRRHYFSGLGAILESKSPDGKWIVGEQDHNLTLRSTLDGRTQTITTDGTAETPWDVSSVDWAPDSSRFVVGKNDYRQVKQVAVVHWLKKNEDVDFVPYSKTGEPIVQTQPYVIEIISGKRIPLQIGPEQDRRFVPVSWSDDARELTILALGRGLRVLQVLRASTETGEVTELLREVLSGHFPGGFMNTDPVVTTMSDGRFIWLSARDGWPHLYLYDRGGKMVRQLTQGEFPVVQTLAVDEKNGWVYFLAHAEERPYDTHLYRVDLQGENFARLTEAPGQHQPVFSPSRQYFIDTHSSLDRPPTVELRRGNGELIEVLGEADISALADLPFSPPEEFVALADDGKTEVHGILYHPPDFDPSKSYPLVEIVYGGPQIAVVPRTFTTDKAGTVVGLTNFARALSAAGFVAMTVDTRGTPGRSQAFHDVSYGHFGRYEIPDHSAVIRQLGQERPYIDTSRVGITGGSWGGYMTMRAMLLGADTYHVGIACNGISDFQDQFGSPGETVLGMPLDNPEGYAYGSNLDIADQLKGKLMLIASTNDVNATFSATMKMVDALTLAGKPYDLMILNEENHHPKGRRKEYWVNRMRSYFEQHLHPET